MSTKIYTGFRLEAESFEAASRAIDDFQQNLEPRIDEKLGKLLVNIATKKLDDIHLGKASPKKTSLLMEAWHEYMDSAAERKRGGESRPGWDFGVSLTLLPFEGKVYGIFYSGDREFQKLWMDRPDVSDFAYWNNSDPDESVSEEAWAERGRVWDAIFEKCSIPAKVGFSRDCSEESPFPSIEYISRNLEKLIPEWERRVSFAVEEIFLDNRIKALGETRESMNFAAYSKIRNDKSPDVALEKQIIRLSVEKQLKKEIGHGDLGVPLPEPEPASAAKPKPR